MAFGRELSSCRHEFKTSSLNCYSCGTRKYQSPAIKTVGFVNPIHINMKLYLKHMRRRTGKVHSAKQINEATYCLLTSICEKFTYGLETLALGLYIYQCLKEISPHQKFWASSCLILASKGIQLDKNVPYLNRYQRYADKDHTQQEYQQAQRTIFEAMNFDIQYSTFYTFLNYYLTSGVVFAKDNLNSSLVQYFEDDCIIKAKQFIKKGNFSQYNQQKLALYIIKDTRKKYNLSEWNDELEQLTGYTAEDIRIEDQDRILQQRKYDTNQVTSTVKPHSQIQPQKIVDLKNICIRKKVDQIPLSKAAFMKNSRPNSNTKQNSVSLAYQTSHNNENNSSIFNPKTKNNFLLAPINSQYLSNNSIFNLATKRR